MTRSVSVETPCPVDLLDRVLIAAIGPHPVADFEVRAEAGRIVIAPAARAPQAAPVVEEETEHGGHVCRDCGRGFATPGGLKSHRQRQHARAHRIAAPVPTPPGRNGAGEARSSSPAPPIPGAWVTDPIGPSGPLDERREARLRSAAAEAL